jgi:hypothetical protein
MAIIETVGSFLTQEYTLPALRVLSQSRILKAAAAKERPHSHAAV